MITQRLRLAVCTGVAALLLVAATSCDVLNPGLVNDLGGDASASGPQPTGSILVVFSNQRGIPLSLSYTTIATRAGASYTKVHTTNTDGGVWAMSHDCDTNSVAITGIASNGGSTTQPSDGSSDLELAITFEKPRLTCGSVIFVSVPLLGSPTADLLP